MNSSVHGHQLVSEPPKPDLKLNDAAAWQPCELGEPAGQSSWVLHNMHTPKTVTTVAAVPRSQESSTFRGMPCFSCG